MGHGQNVWDMVNTYGTWSKRNGTWSKHMGHGQNIWDMVKNIGHGQNV